MLDGVGFFIVHAWAGGSSFIGEGSREFLFVVFVIEPGEASGSSIHGFGGGHSVSFVRSLVA